MSYSSIYVAGDPNHPGGLNEANVFMDWGREFVATHSRWHPDFRHSRTCLQIGTNAVPYIIRNKKSTHLPYRIADDCIDTGLLHFVPDTPDMPYPAYAIWSTAKQQELVAIALRLLDLAAAEAPLIRLLKSNRRSKKPSRVARNKLHRAKPTG